MIERRCELPLPAVQDGDPDVVERLAERMAEVIDGEIPAVGIEHTEPVARRHGEMHRMHGELLLGALALLEPSIIAPDELPRALRQAFNNTQAPHADIDTHLGPAWPDRRNPRLLLKLRLHTASPDNGATAYFANSLPGALVTPGDEESYYFGNDDQAWPVVGAIRAGYDPDLPYTRNNKGHPDYQSTLLPNGLDVVDQTLLESAMYHFTQNPLSSVVMRSQASMGPVTTHGFVSFDTDAQRFAYTSDLVIPSQTL